MAIFVQYHNFDVEGKLDLDFGRRDNLGIFTRKSLVQKSKGAQVYLIAGLGKPRRYFVWYFFTIDRVRLRGEEYEAYGSGWRLDPPRELGIDDNGEFPEFLKYMGHFGRGFTNVEDHPYAQTLERLSKPPALKGEMLLSERLRFWKSLISVCTKASTEYYRPASLLLHRAGDYLENGQFQQALADTDRAIGLSPDMGLAYEKRADVHRRSGQLALAMKDMERAASCHKPKRKEKDASRVSQAIEKLKRSLAEEKALAKSGDRLMRPVVQSVFQSNESAQEIVGEDETITQEPGFGAGFGNSEGNKEIEVAAMGAAIEHYRGSGWQVVDVSSRNLGYDLECRKGSETHHVEVKGIRGEKRSFVITANELRQAEKDPSFVLLLVTSALSARNLHSYPRGDALAKFDFSPIHYRASLRHDR